MRMIGRLFIAFAMLSLAIVMLMVYFGAIIMWIFLAKEYFVHPAAVLACFFGLLMTMLGPFMIPAIMSEWSSE